MGRLVGVLSHLGGVLRRLGAVLGRLGVVLGRLGSVLQAPERETMNFQWFSDFLWGGGAGRAMGALWRGGSIRTPKLPFTIHIHIHMHTYTYTYTYTFNPQSRRRAKRGGRSLKNMIT